MKPACRTIGRERQRLEDLAPNDPISEERWSQVSLPLLGLPDLSIGHPVLSTFNESDPRRRGRRASNSIARFLMERVR